MEMSHQFQRKCSGCRDGAALDFDIAIAFQPIVDCRSGEVFAYEALVRGPEGESAASVFEKVNATNLYAFDQACRVAAIRAAVECGVVESGARLSINFMPNAVYSPLACIQLTLKTAAETNFPLERLIFEFTENEQLEIDHVRTIIDTYRSCGFTTAIDDFGAGYSGLNTLAALETGIIKLDMQLVRDIDRTLPKQHIVGSMVELCAKLNRQIIAEGIETRAEAETLCALGVQLHQGFYYARPGFRELPEVSVPATDAVT